MHARQGLLEASRQWGHTHGRALVHLSAQIVLNIVFILISAALLGLRSQGYVTGSEVSAAPAATAVLAALSTARGPALAAGGLDACTCCAERLPAGCTPGQFGIRDVLFCKLNSWRACTVAQLLALPPWPLSLPPPPPMPLPAAAPAVQRGARRGGGLPGGPALLCRLGPVPVAAVPPAAPRLVRGGGGGGGGGGRRQGGRGSAGGSVFRD